MAEKKKPYYHSSALPPYKAPVIVLPYNNSNGVILSLSPSGANPTTDNNPQPLCMELNACSCNKIIVLVVLFVLLRIHTDIL